MAYRQANAHDSPVLGPDVPLISVVMPVYNAEQKVLEAAIQSVVDQTYACWELCIADDASSAPHIRPVLKRYAHADTRVRIAYRETQGHIAEASNSALDIARGEFVVLLDHDDLLTPDALMHVALVVQSHPIVDFIYSDEDKLDFNDERVEVFFKPAWSPTLLESCNYITHLAALRRSLVIEVGGFRHATIGSQDHDLFLRVAERARAVAHIPLVLYSWRKSATSTAAASTAKPYAMTATHRALQDSIDRRNLAAELAPSHLNGLFHLRRVLPQPAPVSLVVVGPGDEWRRVLGLDGIEIQDMTHLDSTPRARKVSRSDPPRVPAIDDLNGRYLIWIDGQMSASNVDSVLALLEQLQNPRVGVVGGCTVQRRGGAILQAGITIGNGGQPAYAYSGLLPVPQPNFYLNLKDLPHEVSAVHVGCCAMLRSTWQALNGWNEALPASLAMVDLCLRSLEYGYDNVYTPLAVYRSRQPLPPLPQVERYDWAWQGYVDPFWNPNLTPTTGDGLPFRCHGDRHARVRECGERHRDRAGEAVTL
ncbi:MAG: hypothetical protein NVS2B16_02380 [Chloroflexota bacterium]